MKINFNKLTNDYSSAWLGHMKFAHWLSKLLNPSVIVDLGVDYGHSTFSFASANKGIVYGIDSFNGDIQACFKNTFDIVNKLNDEFNNKNYLKTPTFMLVDPGKYIYVGFYHADTAIFRFDLSASNLNWNEYVREQYSEIETYQTTNIETGEEETQTRTTYYPLGFFSFGAIDTQRRFLFAISLEKYSSKIRIMKIGLDNDFIANNSKTIIKELPQFFKKRPREVYGYNP